MHIVCITRKKNCFSGDDLLKKKQIIIQYTVYYIIMYIVCITRKLHFRGMMY